MDFGLGWPKSKLMFWTYYNSLILTHFICSSNFEQISAQHQMNKSQEKFIICTLGTNLSRIFTQIHYLPLKDFSLGWPKVKLYDE